MLHLLAAGRKEGLLTIQHRKEKGQVYLKRGRVAQVVLGRQHHLASMLVDVGALTPDQGEVLRSYRVESEADLIPLAIQSGLIASEEDVFAAVQQWNVRQLSAMTTWRQGAFRYDDGIPAPANRISLAQRVADISGSSGESQVAKGEQRSGSRKSQKRGWSWR